MNYIIACCGHSVVASGAPYSNARILCEQSPCLECAEYVHCEVHNVYNHQCHWCQVRKQAYIKMTDVERDLYKGKK